MSWMGALEALHLACAFDFKVSERRKNEVMQLLALVNEQLWLGHFDLWQAEGVIMYRNALLLTEGMEAGTGAARGDARRGGRCLRALLPGVPVRHLGRQDAGGGARRRAVRDARRSLSRPCIAGAQPLLLVGAGKMGGAMLERWLARGLDASPGHHPRPVSRRRPPGGARQGRDATCDRASAEAADRGYKVMVLAVKPQSMAEALPQVSAARRRRDTVDPVDRRRRAAGNARGGVPAGAADRARHAEHAGAGRHEHDGRGRRMRTSRDAERAVVERCSRRSASSPGSTTKR